MKIVNNKICHAGVYLLLACLTAGFLTACSEDEVVLSALGTPNVTNDKVTVNSLTFMWTPVENVSEYIYELRDPEGELVAGNVTQKTTVVFTGLKPSTTYTLNVWAYPTVYSTTNTASHVATLTATTADVIELGTPQNLIANVQGTRVTITWDAVENAGGYVYSYKQNGEEIEGTVTENTLALSELPVGDYQLSIYAIPEEGEEAYSRSLASTVSFTTVNKNLLWSRKGSFYSSLLDESWDATLLAYDDGSYVISGWFGVDGYDLEFTVEDGELRIQNYYDTDEWGYQYVYTGRTDYSYRGLYTVDNCSSFAPNPAGAMVGGDLWFYDSYSTSCSFDWFLTVDDLVGTWNEHTCCTEYMWYEDYLDWDGMEVEITKVDEQTIKISNFFYSEVPLTATVDFANKTITIPNGQTWAYYGDTYNFAPENDENGNVVATLNGDGTGINVSGWGLWYNGYTWVEGAVTTLTKK